MILCLGEALVDLVPSAQQSPATAPHLAIHPGGAPFNVCIALNRLGVEAGFLGTTSDDAFGSRLRALLEAEGVSRAPARTVPESTRLAVIDPTNPTAPFKFYGDNPADAQLTTDDVEHALREFGPSGLYVGSLQLNATGGRSTQIHAIEMARERGFPVYTDPNPRPAAWASREEMAAATVYLLERATLAKLSLDDAAALGWTQDPSELLRWTSERFPCTIFVTGGSLGCWASIDGAVHGAVPATVNAIDPTGAGDASFAALIARFQTERRLSVEDLSFAATAGAFATLREGAVKGLPTLDEVRSALGPR